MNTEEIIEIARDAGFPIPHVPASKLEVEMLATLERFAKIIESQAKGVRPCCMNFDTCTNMCVPRGAYLGRQEAAKFLEKYAKRFDDIRRATLEVAAELIREKRETNGSKTIVIDIEREE